MILRPLFQINTRPFVYSWLNQIRNVRPTIKISKERFQLLLDVHQFTKDEIRVKARPEFVIIEGKQERKTQDGYVIRKFVKKFRLPNGCNISCIRSELSPDGCLMITAPIQTCGATYPCETVIPIKDCKTNKRSEETFLRDITIDKTNQQSETPKEPKKQPK